MEYTDSTQLHEAQEKGEGLCSTCKGKLDFYYKPWCPICEKPKLEPGEPNLNLMRAIKHLEVIEGNGDLGDRIWGYASDDDRFSNDSLVTYYFAEAEYEKDEQRVKDDQRFKEVFELEGDSVLLSVSW